MNPSRRICLALPTHRECGTTITAVAGEAAYAAEHFGVAVDLLILDSAGESTHAKAVDALSPHPGVTVIHLDEDDQRTFLRRVIADAGVPSPARLEELMLPAAVSYGACTNRAFLIAAALGCASVHRRDSDFAYQNGDLYPIHHELAWLGTRPPQFGGRPVVMAGASFIGDMSVDIDEIRRDDPQAYHDIVSLWADEGTSEQDEQALVAESFLGAGHTPFTEDEVTVGLVDPMRVDMANISFHRVQEQVPLPPMTETIGSDYFLIHLVPDSRLPGVLHNRHIVNYHTPDRAADPAFHAYHLRLAKFFLSMLYLHEIYRQLGAAGESLTDENHCVRPESVARIVRASIALDRAPNVRRLAVLDRTYRRLGGRYAEFADRLAARHDELLDTAAADMADFATLIDAWPALIRASATGPAPAWR